jgi:hypothetical protein
MGPTVSLPRKNIESPAASGFHLPKKYLRPRLPISTADGFSLAPRFYISLKTGGDHGRISLLRSWQCTDDVVRLVLAHLHERLESTDVVRLVLARRRSDMASEEVQLAARTEWRRGGIGSGTSPARRSSTEEAWLGQLLVLGVARTRCLADGAVARSSHGCSARVREREEREHRGKGGEFGRSDFAEVFTGTVGLLRCTRIFRLRKCVELARSPELYSPLLPGILDLHPATSS